MSEGGGVAPNSSSILGKAIDKRFGSFDAFVAKFKNELDGLTGLSFSLLAYNKLTNNLEIMTTKHKDLIFDQSDELVPLLTIETSDLQKDIWKIINWEKVAEKLHIV